MDVIESTGQEESERHWSVFTTGLFNGGQDQNYYSGGESDQMKDTLLGRFSTV